MELVFIQCSELVEKGESCLRSVVFIGPFPGLKGMLAISQSDFSKNTLTNIETMTMVLGGCQDDFGEVKVSRIDVDTPPALRLRPCSLKLVRHVFHSGQCCNADERIESNV
jgi:hypothetical protein